MVEPRDTMKIVNVVASTNIGQEINPKQVRLALDGADYDPKEFPEPEGGYFTLCIGKNGLYMPAR